ncbi:NAD(P)/FAD-dependent oxidoreductase [Kroppenstedtia pulmonis]|uniref:Pyridine nucleotide-disulfide oxidoreductase domain-containing protein 2 n=1 Tax=Kroppenstedtia pulmonis TaxID=1380685 RepID=A0A7D4CKD6_9BACL|nr:NAD(P)/FAD-dependent oxidoreductase [Kroppenstedtia pulmonis]QKG83458.1 NAD(P)/FAD-dependent oxidoreductase [Kroppenstedtia pulmonis]
MNDADAIIIGSGHNGLACAMMLADAGWRVLVVEKAKKPGGASKTGEITLPGFHHDLYATNIGLFLGSQIYGKFQKELHEHGLDIAVSDKPFSSVFPDGDGIGVYQDEQKTMDEFRRISEVDAEAWKQLVQEFKEVCPYLLPLMQMPLPSWTALRQVMKLYRSLGYKKSLELAKTFLQSPRHFAESRFQSEKVRALFIPWAFHLDFGPDVSAGASFPFIEPPMDHMNGMALTKGGISNLIDSMIRVVEDKGGQVILGRDVEKVITDKGRAVGVQLGDGEKLYARRGVVANVTPTQLVARLLDKEDLPSHYVRKGRSYRYGPGTMMVHLALDGPLEWKSGEEYSQFCYVHIAPYVQDVSQTYTDAINGTLPASPMLVVGQQTAVDPTRAPEGKHTLWVQVRAVPAHPHKDALGDIQPADWEHIKEQYADRVIDKLAQYAPNIKKLILARTTLSPRDLEKDNPNLVGGDSVAGSHHADQNYLFRPIPGWSRYKTPVKNLYMVGAATWPGGGMNATSGYLLAKELL